MNQTESKPRIKPTLDFLKRLPKTDLHVHLDGSLRLETIIELAAAQGVQLPATDPQGLDAVRHQIVSSIIDEELLVQQAQRDTSIKVTDEEIASGVEEQVRKVRSNFTSEVEYVAELKKAGG